MAHTFEEMGTFPLTEVSQTRLFGIPVCYLDVPVPDHNRETLWKPVELSQTRFLDYFDLKNGQGPPRSDNAYLCS